MPYSNEVIRRARQRLADAKAQRETEYRAHLALAYERYPRLKEIDASLRSTAAAAISASFTRGEDPAAAIATLREENLALQDERQWILDASDLDEDFLDDSPVCGECGGSGYVGARMCECLRELCRQEQKRELTSLFVTGKESFDNFSLLYYSERYDRELGGSARDIMQGSLAACKKYAASFGPGAKSLLFTGATGLGKTFLSACIARQVAEGGASVVYESASKLFADFEAEKFGGVSGRTAKYLECDLLIIDDLGTEMTTQFTVSALYTVVNTRMVTSRATIISTNLMPEALEGRYSPQIASRLLGVYELIPFVGNDIRPQLHGR